MDMNSFLYFRCIRNIEIIYITIHTSKHVPAQSGGSYIFKLVGIYLKSRCALLTATTFAQHIFLTKPKII